MFCVWEIIFYDYMKTLFSYNHLLEGGGGGTRIKFSITTWCSALKPLSQSRANRGVGVTSQLRGPGFSRKKESMKDRKEVCAQTVGFQITTLPLPQKAAAARHYQNKFGARR